MLIVKVFLKFFGLYYIYNNFFCFYFQSEIIFIYYIIMKVLWEDSEARDGVGTNNV